MKAFLTLLLFTFLGLAATAKPGTYIGSTPAHALVREFLQISATDSIDFIRWILEINSDNFKLRCKYGLIKPSTPDFLNEKQVAFEGQISHAGNCYNLKHNGKSISILEVNASVLHLLDRNKGMLSGNGGWSYALYSNQPAKSDEFNFRSQSKNIKSPLIFEGRTPCQELSGLLGLNKGPACNKMKWYFLFYTDSVTGKPTYFLMNGMGYRKETMTRGSWQIVTGQNGKIIYRLTCANWSRSMDLLKGDDNILFFIDDNGRLLVGDRDFSYTLNRRKEEYARIER